MKIGTVEIKHGVMLAPMAGITDFPFRKICKTFGAEYMVSEMISAKGMHYNDEKTKTLARITDFERPMGIQLFGNDPVILSESSRKLADSEDAPDIIDINMGCPVRKITGSGEGSALMLNLKLAADCISAVVKAVKIPVTVKFRSGWNSENINAVEAAVMAESEGASAVCIHGRTRAQMYAPPVDLEIIRNVKTAVKIPVIGNGGINTAAGALDMFNETGCDGVMVARGALGNPWIFEEIIAALKSNGNNGGYIKPSIEERLKTALTHVELLIENKGGRIGVNEARKHLSWYIKGMNGAASARNKINSMSEFRQTEEIIFSLIEQNRGEMV